MIEIKIRYLIPSNIFVVAKKGFKTSYTWLCLCEGLSNSSQHIKSILTALQLLI